MTRARWFAAPALAAVMQLAMPMPAMAGGIMVQVCGRAAPVRLPLGGHRDQDPMACKICHSAMRKRFGPASCCGNEDARDDP